MTYVISDIHGSGRRFRSILKQIELKPEDTLYVLGDAIDRHPDGVKLLRTIQAMPNAKMLLGNHEYMMLEALGEPYDGPEALLGTTPETLLARWYRNGGNVTHAAWKHQRLAVRQELLAWLKGLPLHFDVTVGDKKYKLVHGAPEDLYESLGAPGRESLAHFCVWDRDAIWQLPKMDYVTVFGHTPTRHFQRGDPLTVWDGGRAVGIDCGSGYPDWDAADYAGPRGRLACLRLEDGAVFYSEEGEEEPCTT